MLSTALSLSRQRQTQHHYKSTLCRTRTGFKEWLGRIGANSDWVVGLDGGILPTSVLVVVLLLSNWANSDTEELIECTREGAQRHFPGSPEGIGGDS